MNFNVMTKFLVISPHPDDLDFGCAGTVAKLTREGNRVEYLIVSDGSKGSNAADFDGKKLAAVRKREQENAARAVGVTRVAFLGEVDGEVENTKRLRKKLVEHIRKSKADVVLTFDPSSLQFESVYRSHRDHRQAAEAVFDAIYPAVGSPAFFPELLKQGLKPHQIEEIWFFASPRPNKVVDITHTIDRKLKALFSHTSQFKDEKELERLIRKRAAAEGRKKSMKYAEAFRVIDFKHH